MTSQNSDSGQTQHSTYCSVAKSMGSVTSLIVVSCHTVFIFENLYLNEPVPENTSPSNCLVVRTKSLFMASLSTFKSTFCKYHWLFCSCVLRCIQEQCQLVAWGPQGTVDEGQCHLWRESESPTSTSTFTSAMTLFKPVKQEVKIFFKSMSWIKTQEVCHNHLGKIYIPSSQTDLENLFEIIADNYFIGEDLLDYI